MEIFLIVFGTLITVIGLIVSIFAAKFDEFNTNPFSKYTFSKLCYEFEIFGNVLIIIGVVMLIISVFI